MVKRRHSMEKTLTELMPNIIAARLGDRAPLVSMIELVIIPDRNLHPERKS
jgi:hypothetical protein